MTENSGDRGKAKAEIVDTRYLNTQRMLRLLARIAKNELNLPRRESYINDPFNCKDNHINNIFQQAQEFMKDDFPTHGLREFSGDIRFPDLDSIGYNSISEFLKKSIENKRDPESVIFEWKSVSIEQDGASKEKYIKIWMVTDKKLVNESGPNNNRAYMYLRVIGSDRSWVTSTFDHLFLEMQEATLPIFPYSILNLFTIQEINQLLCTIIGAIVYSVTYFSITKYLYNSAQAHVIDKLEAILNTKDIGEKIDFLAQAFLATMYDGNWMPLGLSIIFSVISMYVAKLCLPLLAPKSFISIGASKRRVRYYYEIQIAVSGLVVAACVGAIGSAIWDLIKAIFNK